MTSSIDPKPQPEAPPSTKPVTPAMTQTVPPSDTQKDQGDQSITDKIKQKAEGIVDKAAAAKDQVSEKMSQTAAKGKKAAGEAAHTVRHAGEDAYDFVEENLIPIILISAGAAWLTASLLRSSSGSSSRTQNYTGAYGGAASRDTGSGIGEKAGDMTRRAKDAVSGIGEKAGDMTRRAKEAAQRAKEQSRRTRRKSKRLFTENALLVAGGCAALGALIGFAVPETGRERQIYGEVRDKM